MYLSAMLSWMNHGWHNSAGFGIVVLIVGVVLRVRVLHFPENIKLEGREPRESIKVHRVQWR